MEELGFNLMLWNPKLFPHPRNYLCIPRASKFTRGNLNFPRRFIVFVFNEEKINKVDFATVEAINKVTQWLMGNIIKKEKMIKNPQLNHLTLVKTKWNQKKPSFFFKWENADIEWDPCVIRDPGISPTTTTTTTPSQRARAPFRVFYLFYHFFFLSCLLLRGGL